MGEGFYQANKFLTSQRSNKAAKTQNYTPVMQCTQQRESHIAIKQHILGQNTIAFVTRVGISLFHHYKIAERKKFFFPILLIQTKFVSLTSLSIVKINVGNELTQKAKVFVSSQIFRLGKLLKYIWNNQKIIFVSCTKRSIVCIVFRMKHRRSDFALSEYPSVTFKESVRRLISSASITSILALK